MSYGAQAKDWKFFSEDLGLTSDLLPVASNPKAKPSTTSSLRQPGKVPSVYKDDGTVVGIAKWTQRQTTPQQIKRWAQDQDLGICVQTRVVRAIDVDIEDEKFAKKIEKFLKKHFPGEKLPIRRRPDSFKFLMVLRCEGELNKKVLRFNEGQIELLATGQQFVAVGTHPKGERYEWENLKSIPELTLQDLQDLWQKVSEEFKPIAVSDQLTLRRPSGGKADGSDAHFIQWMEENDWITGYGNEGQIFVRCPFEDGHSTDSGITSTAYLPAGTRKYEQGQVKCLHASCSHRTTQDFINEMGYTVEDFKDLRTYDAETWPRFERTKTGQIKPTLNNLLNALSCEDIIKARIAYDKFKEQIYIFPTHGNTPERFVDSDYTRFQSVLEQVGFNPISIELLRRAVTLTAERHMFDSAREWVKRLHWDGKERIKKFLAYYMGAEDNKQNEAISKYMWSALAGRCYETEGLKVDMVPILISEEGTGKSSSIAAIAPLMETFVEANMSEPDDAIARKIRGKLIAELCELRGRDMREEGRIKALITRTHEEWVAKYKEMTTIMPRRCCFVGTTNNHEFLNSRMGHRRWLPVEVGLSDPAHIERDREQLWAEAYFLYKQNGVMWRDVTVLDREGFLEHTVEHPWAQVIEDWLLDEPRDGITTSQLLTFVIGIPRDKQTRVQSYQVAEIMKALGFKQGRARNQKGRQHRVWLPSERLELYNADLEEGRVEYLVERNKDLI